MKNSKIQWTHHTFNPWIGCTKVSPGCANCYAEHETPVRVARAAGRELWGKGQPRLRTKEAGWKEPLRWNNAPCEQHHIRDCQECPRRRVFCASLADWLDREANPEWRADLMTLIHRTPNLNWLLLSKRVEDWRDVMIETIKVMHCDPLDVKDRIEAWIEGMPWRNVWIGTTVEDQQRADERIPELLRIPARVRFLSCEPLLGPVDLVKLHKLDYKEDRIGAEVYPLRGLYAIPDCDWEAPKIHWAICGGESGPNSRPMHPDWARGLRDQCVSAGVPFFFKQWGNWLPRPERGPAFNLLGNPKRHVWPDGWEAYWGSKEANGRLLDGREWNEIPS